MVDKGIIPCLDLITKLHTCIRVILILYPITISKLVVGIDSRVPTLVTPSNTSYQGSPL